MKKFVNGWLDTGLLWFSAVLIPVWLMVIFKTAMSEPDVVWAVFLIIRYLKVNGFFKCALCFAASVVWVAAMTVLSNAWNGMKLSEIFSVKGADNSRYDVIVWLCLAGVVAVLAIAGAVYKFVRKKPQDR